MPNKISPPDLDIYLVSIEGQVVRCATVHDAASVRFADRVIHEGEAASPVQLRHISNVLLSYNCFDTARAIEGRIARFRTTALQDELN